MPKGLNNSDAGVSGKTLNLAAFAVLTVIVLTLFALMTKTGSIWWSDAARNGMNGAFVLDFVKTMPVHDPVGYAYDYYRQWPALTILFYPPLFYVALAAVYAVFGVSEWSAVLTACLFLLGLGWGAYRLSRRWLGPVSALAAAVLTIGIPEMAYWGQQPMLDVPSYALLMWCAVWLVRYLDTDRRAALFWSVLFLVLAIYTKYNSGFFALPVAAAILASRGLRAFTDRKIWQAIGLGTVLMIPLIGIFFTFARYNLEQAASVPTMNMPRWGVAAWTYYAKAIPASVTWPVLGFSLTYLAAAARWRGFRISTVDAVLLSAWIASGYAFYSLVAVKEPRYDLFAVYPIALSAMLLLDRGLRWRRLRLAGPLMFSFLILFYAQLEKPAPYVLGMRAAADAVAKLAPPDSNIGFWGRWDGSFIFDMRAYENRQDAGILRLDKLLESDVVVSFELGVSDKHLTADQILDALRTYHVQYVVYQSGFHEEFPSVKTLADLLHGEQFEAVQTIPITSNYPSFSYLTDLTIYRFRETVPAGRVLPPVQIKLLGKSLS